MPRTPPQIAFGVRSPSEYRQDYVGGVGELLSDAHRVPDDVAAQQRTLGHDLGITWAPVIPHQAHDPASLANLELVVSDLESDLSLRPQEDWDELDGWVFVRVLDQRGVVAPLASYALAVRRALQRSPVLVADGVCETVTAQREVRADRISGM